MNGHEAEGVGVGALRAGGSVGPYELLRPLAQGGMGAVWAARLRGTRGFQQIVALKLLLPRPDAGGEAEAMFLDEARVAARIEHPNVGQILDFGEDHGTLYLAMEWIDGAALSRVRSEHARRFGKPLPERWVLHVVASACAGLHAAHELRGDDGEPLALVHRDVTPQNVMVGFDGFVKLVDFGVAKCASRLCVTRSLGTIKGKIAYLSPEQLRGASLDRRSDLFTLGAMLYVMLTNVHPFRGATDEETLRAIARAAPRPLREVTPRLGADVAAVVDRCLARDPEQRFATAAEVAGALERAVLARGGRVHDDEVGALVRRLFDAAPRSRVPASVLAGKGTYAPRRHGEETADTVPGLDEEAARRLFAEAASGEIEVDVDLDFGADERALRAGPASERATSAAGAAPPSSRRARPPEAEPPTRRAGEPEPPARRAPAAVAAPTSEPSIALPLEASRLGRGVVALFGVLTALFALHALAARLARPPRAPAPAPTHAAPAPTHAAPAPATPAAAEPPAPPPASAAPSTAPPPASAAPSAAPPPVPSASSPPPRAGAEPSARAPGDRPRAAVRGHPPRRRP